MCVCIYIPGNGSVSEERLREAHTANPDGCGLMYAAHNKLNIIKGKMGFDSFMEFYRGAASPCVVHFRTASSGQISDEACHPLQVSDTLAFVQNGNFFEFSDSVREWNDGLTDAQRFNEYFLKRLPPGFFNVDGLKKIEDYCKPRMVKMVFLDSYGQGAIINDEAGEWKDGCWFSNGGIDNYTGYGYSGAYDYRNGDVRSPGGLESVQMFDAEDRVEFSQCVGCHGWYLREYMEKSCCRACREHNALMGLVLR